MNMLRKAAPHGAILIANMYYVFWGIDRVNKSMNFIDNEYTKGLFLILLGFTAVNLVTLYKTFPRWSRNKSSGAMIARLAMMAGLAVFAVTYFILWIVDCFAPHKMLMLNEFVKTWMLILCLLNTVSGVRLAAQDRAAVRQGRRRPAPPRSTASRPAGDHVANPSASRRANAAPGRNRYDAPVRRPNRYGGQR